MIILHKMYKYHIIEVHEESLYGFNKLMGDFKLKF